MPKRIQLRRTKGWRKPEGVIVVSRPTRYGNPFTVTGCLDAGFADTTEGAQLVCVEAFRDWLNDRTWAAGDGRRAIARLRSGRVNQPEWDKKRADYLAAIPDLAGKDLACWCPLDQPCHADVLLELANPAEDHQQSSALTGTSLDPEHLYINCPTHGDHQPTDPFKKSPTCLHCGATQ